MTTEYADVLHNELGRLESDVKLFRGLLDELDKADNKFAETRKDLGMDGVDRDQFGPNIITGVIEHLLTQTETHIGRTLATVKRAKEALKLSGL